MKTKRTFQTYPSEAAARADMKARRKRKFFIHYAGYWKCWVCWFNA